jgi:hypothetical protein
MATYQQHSLCHADTFGVRAPTPHSASARHCNPNRGDQRACHKNVHHHDQSARATRRDLVSNGTARGSTGLGEEHGTQCPLQGQGYREAVQNQQQEGVLSNGVFMTLAKGIHSSGTGTHRAYECRTTCGLSVRGCVCRCVGARVRAWVRVRACVTPIGLILVLRLLLRARTPLSCRAHKSVIQRACAATCLTMCGCELRQLSPARAGC